MHMKKKTPLNWQNLMSIFVAMVTGATSSAKTICVISKFRNSCIKYLIQHYNFDSSATKISLSYYMPLSVEFNLIEIHIE